MNAVLAIDEATCEAKKTICRCMRPPIAFSGTITVAPARSEAVREVPDDKLYFAPITEQSARITTMDFCSANPSRAKPSGFGVLLRARRVVVFAGWPRRRSRPVENHQHAAEPSLAARRDVFHMCPDS